MRINVGRYFRDKCRHMHHTVAGRHVCSDSESLGMNRFTRHPGTACCIRAMIKIQSHAALHVTTRSLRIKT